MMQRYYLSILVSIFIISLLFLACKKEETPIVVQPPVVEMEPEKEDTTTTTAMLIDRTLLLTNLFDNAALPAYQNFTVESERLVIAAQTFFDKSDEINLNNFQNQWRTTKFAWERTEIYDFGSINDAFLHNRIDRYPPKELFLENNLNHSEPIDEYFVANSGSTAKGLPSLEYLLFRAEDSISVLTQFTDGPRAKQYKNYVLAIAQNVRNQAIAFEEILADERAIFLEKIQTGISGSLNKYVNNQISLLEEIINEKINKPFGLTKDGLVSPEKVETPYAKVSLASIRANIEGLEKSFLKENPPSLYDLIDEIDIKEPVKLSKSIQDAIQKNLIAIDAFGETSLYESVTTDSAKVSTLSEAVTELLVLIKVDMASRLSITVVFNDADGD